MTGSAHLDLHELVAFEDPDEQRTWVFDVTFLLSDWSCAFGNGCPGVLTADATELEQGCCSYGAHFIDEADRDATVAAAARLTDEQWQFAKKGRRDGIFRADAGGGWSTRLHQGACILLNRPGHPAGAGCALHLGAVEADERPLDWKPAVCWQLPLRLEESTDAEGHVTSVLREWKRRDWGAGGAEFHWWCTDDPLAFGCGTPAYVSLRDEIVAMVGEAAYALVAEYLDRRREWTPVPHPAVR